MCTWNRHVVVRIIDGGTPQPPQRFAPAEFLLWVAKQITLAEKVFACYEAGPFGYSLHRKLEKMGDLEFSADPARTYAVEASPDLSQWQQIGTPAEDSEAGVYRFADPEPATAAARYYRVVTY